MKTVANKHLKQLSQFIALGVMIGNEFCGNVFTSSASGVAQNKSCHWEPVLCAPQCTSLRTSELDEVYSPTHSVNLISLDSSFILKFLLLDFKNRIISLIPSVTTYSSSLSEIFSYLKKKKSVLEKKKNRSQDISCLIICCIGNSIHLS